MWVKSQHANEYHGFTAGRAHRLLVRSRLNSHLWRAGAAALLTVRCEGKYELFQMRTTLNEIRTYQNVPAHCATLTPLTRTHGTSAVTIDQKAINAVTEWQLNWFIYVIKRIDAVSCPLCTSGSWDYIYNDVLGHLGSDTWKRQDGSTEPNEHNIVVIQSPD